MIEFTNLRYDIDKAMVLVKVLMVKANERGRGGVRGEGDEVGGRREREKLTKTESFPKPSKSQPKFGKHCIPIDTKPCH